MSNKPKLFIGSSSEGLDVAQVAFELISRKIDCVLWDHDVFQLSESTLGSLIRATKEFNFALFILGPDDITESRGVVSASPRDNLLFELGLFMGALGRRRSLVLASDNTDLKLPSDIAGISFPSYSYDNFLSNPKSALTIGCNQIERHIFKEIQSSKKETPAFAAAICINQSREVLLVKTTSGRWSFPKGKVFNKEPIEYAVRRIARSKGGISDGLFKMELPDYEDTMRAHQVNITPFLLSGCKNNLEPTQSFRQPTWFPIQNAIKTLSIGRNTKAIAEIRKILKISG